MESLSQAAISFLEKYFQENGLTRHHTDTYDKCMFEEIPTIIHTANPIVFLKDPIDKDNGIFGSRVEIFIGGDVPTPAEMALTISPPVISLDDGRTVRRMFPNEARLRNMTYSAQVSADILIRSTFTVSGSTIPGTYDTVPGPSMRIPAFPLFRMPILLRSRLCATGGANQVLLEEMGECRNDYGGYFIIGGAEKVLITREEQAFNSLYVAKRPPSDVKTSTYASVVSLHPETKQTRRVALNILRGDGEIRVTIPMVRGAFPVFILFRALGLESDEDIVRMIFPTPDPLEENLIASVYDAYPIMSRYLAIKYIMTLTKGFTEAHVLDIIQNLLLPHVQDEPLARAYYLAEMVREALRVDAGQRMNTDRDDMRNQRFLTTGTLVRELFNGCWKDWRAQIILNVDTLYRKHPEEVRGQRILDIFTEGNQSNVFQPAMLNNAILRGFRGKWGTNPRNEKVGVLQALSRISYLDAMSHVRRVVADVDSGMKITGPRKLHTSQIGYFCTSETPNGAHIGITKNMSILTQFSTASRTKPLYDWLRMKGGVRSIAETTAEIRATAAIVQVNGGTIGCTATPVELTKTLKLMKWNACIAPSASISFNTSEKTVRIYVDEGRPIRPLWHLNGRGAEFLGSLDSLLTMSWRDLVMGTFPAMKHATLSSTHFVDPLGDQPGATFQDYEALLTPTAGFIEYMDPTEMNEAYISWWGDETMTPDHTHCEIHPSTMQGLLASMIPYSNHNQAPRNQLSNSQSKQAIGYMATNIHNRFDTYSHQLCYGESPLCRTFYYDALGNGEMPYGFNCILAVASITGYNQDDGLILNRDSIARGMFQSLAFRSYNAPEEVDALTKAHSHVANPIAVPLWKSLRPGLDYTKLDERGIIREGEIVDDKTVLVGRYMVLPETREIKDASLTPNLYTSGRVDSVVVLHQADGRLLVKVRVIELRIPVLGDKFSSRHGQKGTIGALVAAEDMPYTADGIVPDVIVNPGGLISRMTVAQLVEMLGGRVGLAIAAKMHATTFCNDGDVVQKLGDILQQSGVDRCGDNILYSGITGEQIRTEIFMCPLYFMRLKHLTEDKVNSREKGRREIRTHQATGGRGNEGGLRIGEMERDSLCAHGISTFLQESMMKRGDATTFWVCNGCGRIPIYNEAEKLFVCSTCDGPLEFSEMSADTMTLILPTKQSRATFSQIEIPYAMKLLDQEMSSLMNAGLRIITERSVARLKESTWNWKVEPIAEDVPEGVLVAEKSKAERTKKSILKTAGSSSVSGLANTANTVRFSDALENDYKGLATGAIAPFMMPLEQLPGESGREYPPLKTESMWDSVDHYVAAMKFPDSPEYQMAIQQASSAAEAKKMGVNRTYPVRTDWESIRNRIVKSALLAKFRQNPDLRKLLVETKEKQLLYATPDSYWGEGPMTQDKIAKGEVGKGKNVLGTLLQEVRADLASSSVSSIAEPIAEEVEEPEPSSIVEDAMDMVRAVTTGSTSSSSGSSNTSGLSSSGSSGSSSNTSSNASESKESKESESKESESKEIDLDVQTGTQTGTQVGGSQPNAGQPMYFLLQPQFGGMEMKARNRDRGTGRNIRFAGMTAASDIGGEKEITVEKLE